jgi:hypothetical protein
VRYRITEDGAVGPQAGGDFVALTVWFTLFVGIAFLVVGIRGRQRWLQFWGALTCVSCLAYFGRGFFGLA